MLTLQFDGLFRCAPHDLRLGESAGFMCYGWVILRDGTVIARGHGGYARTQDASSNVAEYLALIEGLEALHDLRALRETVVICGDAKSIIEQMQGRASVSATSIKPLNRRARKLASQFHNIHWSWTPRRNNHTADALTRRALRQIRANVDNVEDLFADALADRKRHGHKSSRLHSLLDLRMYQTATI